MAKNLSAKILELQQLLDRAEKLVVEYRSQAVTAEVEVLRLNQEKKTLQCELQGCKDQNSKLVDRIIALLHDQELKQS